MKKSLSFFLAVVFVLTILLLGIGCSNDDESSSGNATEPADVSGTLEGSTKNYSEGSSAPQIAPAIGNSYPIVSYIGAIISNYTESGLGRDFIVGFLQIAEQQDDGSWTFTTNGTYGTFEGTLTYDENAEYPYNMRVKLTSTNTNNYANISANYTGEGKGNFNIYIHFYDSETGTWAASNYTSWDVTSADVVFVENFYGFIGNVTTSTLTFNTNTGNGKLDIKTITEIGESISLVFYFTNFAETGAGTATVSNLNINFTW